MIIKWKGKIQISKFKMHVSALRKRCKKIPHLTDQFRIILKYLTVLSEKRLKYLEYYTRGTHQILDNISYID